MTGSHRLASALGLARLGNRPEPNPEQANLWAAMLDSAASWDAIAYRHAPVEVADRLVTNPLFEAVATKGTGVFDTLKGVVKLVLSDLRNR